MNVTTFASGSGGNCTLVSMGGARFLIDAGISFKRIREHLSVFGLKPDALTAVLITHEHSDHVGGLATMAKYTETPVFAPRTVANRLRCAAPGVEKNLREFPVGEDVLLDGVAVRAFHTPHDTDESVGWRLAGDRVFALATDMGHVTDEIRAGLTGADVALIEANHDVEMLRAGPYPYHLKKRILSGRGHLSNDDCAARCRAPKRPCGSSRGGRTWRWTAWPSGRSARPTTLTRASAGASRETGSSRWPRIWAM